MATSTKRTPYRSSNARSLPPRGFCRPWVGAIAIFVITIIAYLPAFRAGYVWDDDDHVTQAPMQRTLTALKWVWTRQGTTPQYYPLTHTTFWIEYRLWGMNPAGYHAVNVVLQAINALLLWRVLSRLGVRGAWLAAAIFAIHPVHVESVAWITERKNTLSGFFYLLAMIAALRAFGLGETQLTPTKSTTATRSEWLPYTLCILCFFAAVLGKTVTCTLPAALVLLIWWKREDRTKLKRDALMLLPMFAIGLIVAKTTSGMERSNVGATGPEFDFSFADRVLIAGRDIWFYAGKFAWPVRLAFIYPRWNIDPHVAWQWIFPIGVIAVVGVLWLLRDRIGRGPIVAVLFFIGTLFPALGFVNVYPMRFSFVADHFQYLASIGLIVLAANLLSSAPVSDRARKPVIAALLLALGCLTFHQAVAYRDAPTLWRDTLAKNPYCWLAMDNLGADADARGDTVQALDWYNKSLAVNPNQREAHWNRGRLFEQEKRWDDSAAEFTAAAAIRPDDTAVADHEMAKLLVLRGDFDGGAAEYEKVLSEEPRLEPARLEYAALLRRLNRPQDARRQYQAALELNPDSVGARSGLAGMAFLAGDLPEALRLMSEAIDINPADPKLCNNYGVFLMQAGRTGEAAEQFSNAIAADPGFPEAYDGLGNALQAQGNLSEAERMYRKAISLRPEFAQAREHLERLRGR